MEDKQIITLYFQRREEAIAATASKFGNYCYSIAYNILRSRQDSEEVTSDTYMEAWNAMPPHRPNSLAAFLGKITRRNALDRWDYLHAAKRGGGEVPLVLEELKECASTRGNPELELQMQELGSIISGFLRQLPERERSIFIMRYWYLDSVKEISHRYGDSQSRIKSQLFRTRKKLRLFLEQEGVIQ